MSTLTSDLLAIDDVKHMLLGHWGTTLGQNFIYAHLNRIINRYDLDMIYVSGPGHGGRAVVGNAFFAFHAYPWLIHRLTYRRHNHANIDRNGQDIPEIRNWMWEAPSKP